MTVRQLLHTQPTISQLDIQARADRMFAASVGRYFGGQLTNDQVRKLADGIELRKSTRAMIDALPPDPPGPTTYDMLVIGPKDATFIERRTMKIVDVVSEVNPGLVSRLERKLSEDLDLPPDLKVEFRTEPLQPSTVMSAVCDRDCPRKRASWPGCCKLNRVDASDVFEPAGPDSFGGEDGMHSPAAATIREQIEQSMSRRQVSGPERWKCKRCGEARRRSECLVCGNQEPITDEDRVSGLVS